MRLFEFENSNTAIGFGLFIMDNPFEYRCLLGGYYDKEEKFIELHLFFIKITIK